MVQGRVRLTMKDRALLIASEIITHHPWLQDLLLANERITQDLVETLPPDKQSFFDNVLERLIKPAVDEWKNNTEYPVEDKGSDSQSWLKCSLCGTPNRYIFYLTNRLNGNSLNVGSDCVKHFGLGGDIRKSVAELIHDATRTRRLSALDKRFSGIASVVDRWNDLPEQQLLITPASLERSYTEVGRRIREICEAYLNEKLDESSFAQLEVLLDQGHHLARKIQETVEENKANRFAAAREIGHWLRNRGEIEVLQMIKEDGGLIKWKTAHRIEEPEFMRSLVPEFNRNLQSIGVTILGVDTERGGYVLELQTNKVQLFCKHRDLVLNYGWLLFAEKPDVDLTLQGVIGKSRVNTDEHSLDFIVRELASKTGESGVRFWGYDLEFDELILFELQSSRYLVLPLRSLADAYKELALGMKGKNVNDLMAYVKGPRNQRYSRDDFNERRNRHYVELS